LPGLAFCATLFCVSLFMLLSGLLGLSKDQTDFGKLSARVRKEPLVAAELSASIMKTSVVPISEPSPLPQYAELAKENSDLFGWIKIEGTKVDYPVMYTPDEPEYYLHRAFDKTKSTSGIPFLDGDYKEQGSNYLIYGHNMKNGTMFKTLLSYKDKEFYRKHSTIAFDTIYETGTYEVVGAFYSRVFYQNEQGVFRFYKYTDLSSPSVFSEYVEKVKKASLYDTGISASYGDTLLTLITCSYHTEHGRFVVVARKK